MDFYIKQKVFSIGDKFSIYDEAGNEAYHVQGEVFSFGKKLHLYDAAENELALIQQKVLSWLPKYYIKVGEEIVDEVVKEFTLFRQEYTVKELGWKVHGNFFEHTYDISEGDTLVASIKKDWFTWGDAYRISVAPSKDVVKVLAVVLIIDACIEAQNNRNN